MPCVLGAEGGVAGEAIDHLDVLGHARQLVGEDAERARDVEAVKDVDQSLDASAVQALPRRPSDAAMNDLTAALVAPGASGTAASN